MSWKTHLKFQAGWKTNNLTRPVLLSWFSFSVLEHFPPKPSGCGVTSLQFFSKLTNKGKEITENLKNHREKQLKKWWVRGRRLEEAKEVGPVHLSSCYQWDIGNRWAAGGRCERGPSSHQSFLLTILISVFLWSKFMFVRVCAIKCLQSYFP